MPPRSDHRQKRILVVWYCDPRYIPPFSLSERQVTVGPKWFPDQPQMMFAGFTPRGAYDLEAAVSALKIDKRFDAIVVWADASGVNFPLNLEAFDCPRVLCVGDTHHLQSPLNKMLAYARATRYDFMLSSHNRQHLHWFAEAGFSKLAWLPGLKVQHFPRRFTNSRKRQICFVGNVAANHQRRHCLLETLERNSLPLLVTRAPQAAAADVFASSLVSFNASLNGDLNLRVFEVLSAGGCLVTDRLSEQSGFHLILKEERDFIGYDTESELVRQTRTLLERPNRALDIARSGNRAFTRTMLPEHRAAQLLAWIFDDRLDDLFRFPSVSRASPVPLKDRIRVYEDLQELQRTTGNARVIFAPQVPGTYLDDAADLQRVAISLTERREHARQTAVATRNELETVLWDRAVMPRGAPLPPFVRFRQAIPV